MPELNETAIVDRMFTPNSAIHANGDRLHARPRYVRWSINQPTYSQPVVWFTDGTIPRALHPNVGKRVGLLLEPPQLHPENYEAADQALRQGFLDVLYTHQVWQFPKGAANVRAYPLGGTRIHESDWRIWEKSRAISCIASPKRSLPGHALRHEVIAALPQVDAYGPDYNPATVRSKLEGLAPYRFSVVTESVNTGVMLSEHLLDCFLTGTVPIYWGNRSATEVWGFNERGIWYVESLESLVAAATIVADSHDLTRFYAARSSAIEHNFIKAHEYTCPEDWLYRHDPSLFA